MVKLLEDILDWFLNTKLGYFLFLMIITTLFYIIFKLIITDMGLGYFMGTIPASIYFSTTNEDIKKII